MNSKSSYLQAISRTKPNFVQITAETSSAGSQGGRAWRSRYSLLPITHAPLSAHSTPFCLVSDSYTLGTPSWLPVRLASEAPGLKTGSLVWIYAAWVKILDHGHSTLCTLLPRDTEQSASPLGCSIYCHLGRKHSRVWKGRDVIWRAGMTSNLKLPWHTSIVKT